MADVQIYDTTLRDGAQMPGVAFSLSQQVRIATALDELGVDEIEIGFAASGPAQQADMAAVAQLGLRARTLSLARPLRADVDDAVRAGVDGVIVFTALSDLHLAHKLRRSYPEALATAVDAVQHARDRGLFVQISLEDGTRTPPDRLVEASTRLTEAGAHRVSMADTVGIGTSELMSELVGRLVAALDVPVAVHCHDDFGLAVANTVAAVLAGASVISTTVNGIGERSGNAATEVCVLALSRLCGRTTNVRTERITEVCQLVAECAGVPLPANRPVVGGNSFRHESGIHVAAMLTEPACYEPYDPALVGGKREFVLGKTSGRTALRHLVGASVRDLDDETVQWLLEEIKATSEFGRLIDAETVNAILKQAVR